MHQQQLDRTKLAKVLATLGEHLSRSGLNRVLAPELEARLGYQSLGLNAGQARDQLYEEYLRQQAIRSDRAAAKREEPQPGRILQLAVTKASNRSQSDLVLSACLPLLDAQTRGREARVQSGDVIFAAKEVGTWSNRRYSKTWHRQHGGVFEVSERRVNMLRPGPLGTLQVASSIQVPAFRGHWLVRAIASILELPKPQVPASLRSVQGLDLFSIERVTTLAGAEIYRRKVGPIDVDFCALCDGATFHAATPELALEGLARKSRQPAQASPPSELISRDTGLQLGFCMAGIQDFCDVNGIDVEATLTRTELRRIVARRRDENASRWERELRELDLL
jgi:hypothetical protein